MSADQSKSALIKEQGSASAKPVRSYRIEQMSLFKRLLFLLFILSPLAVLALLMVMIQRGISEQANNPEKAMLAPGYKQDAPR